MTGIHHLDVFSDEPPNDDNGGFIIWPERQQIVHGCEGAWGISWTAGEAREAARRLNLMADELDGAQRDPSPETMGS